MARYAIALPDQAVARAFTKQIEPWIERIVAGCHERRTRAGLRNALLPKLISGKLRVTKTKNP